MPEPAPSPVDPSAALEMLIRDKRESLLRIANRMLGAALRAKTTAEDVFQQTCENAHRAIGTFQWDGDLESAMERWFRAIMRNVVITFSRRRDAPGGAGLVQLASDLAGGTEEGATPSRNAAGKEAWAALEQALNTLPKTSSAIVKMHYFDSLTLAEIAARLEITPDAVNMRLDRARRKLRDLLGPSSAFFFIRPRRRPPRPPRNAAAN